MDTCALRHPGLSVKRLIPLPCLPIAADSWATQETNTRSGADTWRCKECHGWDYLGRDGAYASGSHFTGFPGVADAAQSLSDEELLGVMKGETSADHDFSAVMPDVALNALVMLLKEGLVDVPQVINYETKAPVEADAAHGEELWNRLCTFCHGPDGRNINFGDDEEPEYVGTVAQENPQEFLHKDRFGQPGSDPEMPSTVDLGWSLQDVLDVLAFAQTMPTEPPDVSPSEHEAMEEEEEEVPDEANALVNPIEVTEDSIATGAGLFAATCSPCHGETGQGDGPLAKALAEPPANLHEDPVQVNSDGALFWISTHGVPDTPMQPWEQVFSEEERWHLVNFLRTFR